MLKIELIRFEAQDVITASGVIETPAPVVVPCTCEVGSANNENCNPTNGHNCTCARGNQASHDYCQATSHNCQYPYH